MTTSAIRRKAIPCHSERSRRRSEESLKCIATVEHSGIRIQILRLALLAQDDKTECARSEYRFMADVVIGHYGGRGKAQ